MKEKIIAAIKAKFPAVNLSKKRLDEISAKLETKVTDESEIDAKLDEFNDYNPFAEIAKQDDAFANLQSKIKKPSQQQTPQKKKKKDDDQDDDDDEPDEPVESPTDKLLKELLGKVNNLEKEKVTGSIKQKLSERLKDVPASIWSKRAMPEKEEDLEAFVTEVQDDYKTDFVDKGLITNPGSGSKGGSNGKATKEEISGIVDKILPKQ